MSEENRLGDYLRARREQVTPAMVGLPPGGVRRVAGLRREEVAMLAGISADYYLRLEQGRDRNPSAQVLEAIARVLQLDETATDHLLRLGVPRPRPRSVRLRPETVPPEVLQLLGVLGQPAFVEGQWLDVLAANPLATALNPNLRVGENRLRSLFLDPAERDLHPAWETLAPRLVAGFRRRVADVADDPRVAQLVGELTLGSEVFARLWARHDVKQVRGKTVRLDHPQVGEMTLAMSKLAVEGSAGLLLVVHHAEPGTASAERLALLSSLAGGGGVGGVDDRSIARF
ncbi:helix-turn-helix transcriptional regulator [Nocardioides sp. SOB77]|uniref:Helix-turn-helix transcriptional regulator n=1 Tax=Nocardioides oceani TaxID=3058369 RepID=A0ABT8FFA3_9ACTN|nr:helix-turn-helix transcriptional regulator [Nocardioides oceani]MDN4173361.1 helix-turn-helix transcriptional regulator [Nocardioides oceani]